MYILKNLIESCLIMAATKHLLTFALMYHFRNYCVLIAIYFGANIYEDIV